MKIRVIIYLTGLILLAAGITAVAEENKFKPLNEKEFQKLSTDFNKGKDCIYSHSINDWVLLDDQSLIIYAPTKNRPYYVKLNMRSIDLKYAYRIGFYSRFDDRICPYGGNALFIDGERHTIRAIKKLDKTTAKQLIAFKKKKSTRP